jgi:hypothetical protein
VRPFHIVALIACSACFIACKDGAQPSRRTSVDPARLQSGPIQHEQLSAAHQERIKRLQQTFSEVDPNPLEKWIEDFQRDRDPEREIHIYEGMAAAYSAYCTGRALTLLAKRDVYQVVILRSGAPDADVLPQLKLSTLSLDDANDILRLYPMAPAPITVSTSPAAP